MMHWLNEPTQASSTGANSVQSGMRGGFRSSGAVFLFSWVEGGSWDMQRRPTWKDPETSQSDIDPRTGIFEAPRSRLSLSGNLIGLAEAEVLFIGEGSDPTLILEQLTLALRVSRPWAIVFVLNEEGGGREWQREILLGIRDLIDEEIAQIKFWRFTWKTEVARVLDEKLWDLALEKGAEASRLELLFIDAMVPVPPGRFWMGSEEGVGYDEEKPRHEVTISEGFWMSQTAVTQGLYALVMGRNRSRFEGATRPVEYVSWFDALRFCNRLSELAGLEPVYEFGEGIFPAVSRVEGADGFQLPTEAEWEYAAKAGTELTYAGSDVLDDVAWHQGNANRQTHPVGQKRSNANALYGLSGNVFEWCFDEWDAEAYDGREGGVTDPVIEPPSALEADYRVCRGGCWFWRQPLSCRERTQPEQALSSVGMRLVRRIR